MSDGLKKPKDYRRGRCLATQAEFDKVCREELAAGKTVVVTRPAVCAAPFPCLADIYVYAGLDSPCPVCEPNIQKMRDLHGWEPDGEFWVSKHLTPAQQRLIADRIGRRRGFLSPILSGATSGPIVPAAETAASDERQTSYGRSAGWQAEELSDGDEPT